MKKFLKSFVAAVLAVMMVITCVPAFAANYFVPPNFGEENPAEEFVFEDFTVDATGYYNVIFLSIPRPGIYEKYTPGSTSYSEVVSDEAYNIRYDAGESFGAVYYLEKDTTYYAKYGFDGEFLGEEMTSVLLNDSTELENLILGADVCKPDVDFNLNLNAKLVFSSAEISISCEFPFICEAGIAEGENTILPDVPVYSGEALVLTAYPAEKFISDISFKNSDKCTTAYIDYKDNLVFADFSQEEVIVNCENGKKEVVLNEYAVVNTHGNKTYFIDAVPEVNENAPVKINIWLVGNAGRVLIKSYDCKIYEGGALFNMERTLIYYKEELTELTEEILAKYESLSLTEYRLLFPFIFCSAMAEYIAKSIPLYFKYISLIVDFYMAAMPY